MSDEAFDRERYFELLGADPLAAANYVDQFRYQHNNPVGAISQAVNATLAQQQAAVAGQFIKSHPDFPTGDEFAASTLRERVGELVTQGMPFSADLMAFAYYQLQREGKITQEEPEPRATAPDASGAQIESLSDAELKKLLDQHGMFR
jgi:hypothetical protein